MAIASVVGMGYVGQSLSLGLADSGYKVIGIDLSKDRIDDLQNLKFDSAPDDKERFAQYIGVPNPQIELTQSIDQIGRSEIVFICVPTPTHSDYSPNYQSLESACRSVVKNVQRGQLIVLCSTTSIGSTRRFLVQPLQQTGIVVGKDVFVGYSPERVDPGNTEFSASKIPRIVAGFSEECAKRALDVVSDISSMAVLASSLESAEMTKLVENTFRAVNITWANEISNVAQLQGIDPIEVMELASTKPYGFMRFSPGPGVGGHCIPSDPHFFLDGISAAIAPITHVAMQQLHARPQMIANVVSDFLKKIGGNKLVILGVSYKPNVADTRDSPAIEVIQIAKAKGFSVDYIDPHVPQITLGDGSILKASPLGMDWKHDLAVVFTPHKELLELDFSSFGFPVVDCSFQIPPEGNVSRISLNEIFKVKTIQDQDSKMETQGLSILLPAYNEQSTVRGTLQKLCEIQVENTPFEIIVVNDGSTDGTSKIIKDLMSSTNSKELISYIEHEKNLGKGAAIRSGLEIARGKYFLVFDADEEYSTRDISSLLEAATSRQVDVVYGVRIAGHNVMLPSFIHALGNRVLTFCTNFLYGAWLSDMHTCLKLFPTEFLRSVRLTENGFGLDTELTAIALRTGLRPFEVPSSYVGRTRKEGKKIGLRDAFVCIIVLLKVRFRRRIWLEGGRTIDED